MRFKGEKTIQISFHHVRALKYHEHRYWKATRVTDAGCSPAELQNNIRIDLISSGVQPIAPKKSEAVYLPRGKINVLRLSLIKTKVAYLSDNRNFQATMA